MKLVLLIISLIGIIIGSSIAITAAPSYGTIQNKDVSRLIDLTIHIAEETTAITFVNNGATAVDSYYIVYPASYHHSFIEVHSVTNTKKTPTDKDRLVVEQVAQPSDARVDASEPDEARTWYRVVLATPLAPGAETSIAVHSSFTRTLTPLPAVIDQGERQLVWYSGNAAFYSPYLSANMKSQFKLGTNKIESYTRTTIFNDETISRDDDKITYGPFTNVAPLSRSIVEIHYQNNAPFVTFTKVIRELEVSHHGNLAVEEHYSLLHTGAKLRGSFSRHDYQRDPNGFPASYRYLTAHLPAAAFDIYYRDIIGNVSTSHVRNGRGSKIMDVEPRYPMMGGWAADFYIGYSVPLTEFLSTDATDSARFILSAPFATPFPVAAIDEIEVRVILPESASSIEWRAPFDIDSEEWTSRQTYLDLVGRPVLVLKKSNVVRHHNLPFHVGYNYSTILMIQEPLLVIIGFMAFFIAVMVYMRLELTITHQVAAKASRGTASETAATATSLRSRRDATQGGLWINKLLNAQNELVHAYDNRLADRPQVYALINQATGELRKSGDAQLASVATRLDTAQWQLRGAARRYKEATTDAEIEETRGKYVERLADTLEVLKELALV